MARVIPKPDVMLVDIGLPGLDGYAVARELHASGRARSATLIALSGYGQADDCRRSQEAGFAHHLTKPVEPETLRSLLARLAP